MPADTLPHCHEPGCNMLAQYTRVVAVGRYGDWLSWTSVPVCWQHGDSAIIELNRALGKLPDVVRTDTERKD